MNAQFAIKDDTVYVLEVNPRASRTVPYLSKATGVPLAKVAAHADDRADARGARADRGPRGVGVLRQDAGVPVRALPRRRHAARARDEVHRRGDGRRVDVRQRVRQGADGRRAAAAAEGTAFISVNNHDKPAVVPIARDLRELGFRWSPRAAPPTTCARTASRPRSSSRSTKAVRTSATRSSTTRSSSSSTRRSAASRSSTTGPCGGSR